MPDRRDALLGAAHLVVAVRALADAVPDDRLHTSVARFDVEPDSPVVVAREVRMNVDLCSADQDLVDAAVTRLRAEVDRIAKLAQVGIELVQTHAWQQQPYQDAGVRLARAAAEAEGLSYREVMMIAGHDSTNLNDVVPTVMLFVPSVDGIAHNEGELTRDEDCTDGVRLLTGTLRRLCANELDGLEVGH